VLRRGGKADNCDKRPGTWLVAGGEANDCWLDAATWLDEAAGRRTRCAGCARDCRAESARRSLPQLAASTADRGGYPRGTAGPRAASCPRASNRRAARRPSRPEGARELLTHH